MKDLIIINKKSWILCNSFIIKWLQNSKIEMPSLLMNIYVFLNQNETRKIKLPKYYKYKIGDELKLKDIVTKKNKRDFQWEWK